jgi:hypothetical protein
MTRHQVLRYFLAACLVQVAASESIAQQFTVTPAKGQSAQQVESDMAACSASATQPSAYDPAQAGAAAPAQPQVGGRVKGATAAGAAGLAAAEVQGRQYEAYENLSDDAKQEYRRNDAKSAAAAGAVAGGVKQRQDRRQGRRQNAQTQQQQQQQQASAAGAYDQAYKACLQGRGYTVSP